MNEQDSIFYISKDNLGSFDVITNPDGSVKERYNYDPWGRRRNPTDWSYNNVPEEFFLDRGFTGHEHLDKFELINMNGRVYDQVIAMFLSPDNFVQSPDLTQNFNRYTYCLNNPLKFTDPSGYNYMQYMQQHYQNFDYRGGYYSEGTYYQASMGGGYGGYAPTTNISYDATHPHDLWSVGPGQGLNGNGLNGSYYDYYTGQYRSTSSMEAMDWLDVYDNAVLPYASAFIDVAAIRQYEKDQWNKSLTASLDGPDTKNVVYNIANTLNEFNPVAQLWDVISYALTGNDRFGNPISLAEACLKALCVIPIGETGNFIKISGFTEHGLNQVISRGFTSSNNMTIMREGTVVKKMGRYGTQYRYTLGGNTIVVNSRGEIVTVFSTANDGVFIPFK